MTYKITSYYKNLPKFPRYDRSKEFARDFNDFADIKELPVDPFKYYKEND